MRAKVPLPPLLIVPRLAFGVTLAAAPSFFSDTAKLTVALHIAPGLQPERTELAWGRTLVALLAANAIFSAGCQLTGCCLRIAEISGDIGLLLAKLHALGSGLNNRALAEFGLRERSFSVLTLACSGLEPTQRELAGFLSLDPSQIVSLVDELESRGLVERVPGKQDRRVKIVAATSEGSRIHDRARTVLQGCEKAQLAALAEGEAAQLRSFLRKALWGVKG